MNEHWQRLTTWWQQLALREKRALILGGIAISIFIIYQAMWSPLLEQVNLLRKQFKQDQLTLVWMQAADVAMQKMNKQNTDKSTLTPIALLSELQKQIEQAGMQQNVKQLKQTNNEAVELQLQKVEFDAVMQMLLSVMTQYQVVITQMSAAAEGKTRGVVNVEIRLTSA